MHNASLVESKLRSIIQFPLPELIPSLVSENEPGAEAIVGTAGFNAQLFEGKSSIQSPSRPSPRCFPVDTMDSNLLRSNASQYPTALCRNATNQGWGTLETSGDLFDFLQNGNYENPKGNDVASETTQLFLSECNFENSQPAATCIPPRANPGFGLSREFSADWERHRDFITKMYFEEQKTLKEIMDIMKRKYGFKPTSVFSTSVNGLSLTIRQ